ncbi:hypothetical protein SAY87_008797 [Trapa incisa]|uniref:Pentatricopeptide repeat-containing protein n=1 Tax=Trapa incisa TaxID=236973 RepID=A0AAN7JU83_9MYRT|nr:hypothetical protein SAY87_008797 [Trapa incisa]
MSSVVRQLHRVFSASQPAAAAAAAAATATATARTTLTSTKVRKLLDSLERSLKPPSGQFRRQSRVLEAVHKLSSAGHTSLVDEILRDQKQRIGPESELFAAYLIELYGAAGMFDLARELFDEMPNLNCPPTIRSLNSLLQACVKSERFNEVERLVRDLPVTLSLEPDLVTYNILVGSYCRAGSIDCALLVIDEISEKGLQPEAITFTPLLVFFYRSGRFKEGDHIWDLMESKNITLNATTYHIKLHAMVSHDKLADAVELFADMEKKSVIPDVYCYNALIIGFCRKEDSEEAKNWYQKLVKSSCSPDFVTMSMLIPFFRKKNDLDMVYVLCTDLMCMSFRISPHLVQRVVDDLVQHSKLELAEELVKLSSSDSNLRYNLKIPSVSR